MGQRTDPGVPIPDRRRHRRWLTLRNAGTVTLVLVVIFLAISLRSELRGLGGRDYGRIVDRALPEVKQEPVPVVREVPPPVADQTAADPMLIAPMEREQWLLDAPAPVSQATYGSIRRGDVDLAIVGGPEGVTIVRRDRTKPVLSGGFGRPADPR